MKKNTLTFLIISFAIILLGISIFKLINVEENASKIETVEKVASSNNYDILGKDANLLTFGNFPIDINALKARCGLGEKDTLVYDISVVKKDLSENAYGKTDFGEEDYGSQDIVVDANILDVVVDKFSSTIELTFDETVTSIFSASNDLITITKNGDKVLEYGENDNITFSQNKLKIHLADSKFLSDAEKIKVAIKPISIAFNWAFNTVEIESKEIVFAKDSTSLPLGTSEFQLCGAIKKMKAIGLVFNKGLQSVDSSSIKILDKAGTDITTKYPISTKVEGLLLDVLFETLPPTTGFRIKILANSVSTTTGEIITEDVVTDIITFDSTLIYDENFKDNSIDVTGKLRITSFEFEKEKMNEKAFASFAVTLMNDTEKIFDMLKLTVVMYDIKTKEKLSETAIDVGISLYMQKTVFVNVNFDINAKENEKYKNGGYYFKAFIFNNEENIETLVDSAERYVVN